MMGLYLNDYVSAFFGSMKSTKIQVRKTLSNEMKNPIESQHVSILLQNSSEFVGVRLNYNLFGYILQLPTTHIL